MRRTLSDIGLALGLFCAAGCPGEPTSRIGDMKGGAADQGAVDAAPADLRAEPDLRADPDMRKPPDLSLVDLYMPDLYMPDLAPATLDPKPACAAATVMAADVYAVVAAKCGATCHLNGFSSGDLSFGGTAATMKAALVNVDARFAPLKRVKPSDVDSSLLLYKLLGQQVKITNAGGQMPQGDTLSDAQICLFYNWVRTGAN